MNVLQTARFESPVGELLLWVRDEQLVGLEFAALPERVSHLTARLLRTFGTVEAVTVPDPAGAISRLERYFAGDLSALADQRVLTRGTEFEERVWAALRTIPLGATRSYGEIATAIGAPGASRAVGAANGRNPVAIFVPCHRVVATGGALHGYGGGLERKQWLLRHEGAKLESLRKERQRTLALAR